MRCHNESFPLFCPKCKPETLIDVQQLNIFVIKEPDAEPIIRSQTDIKIIGSFSLVFAKNCESMLKKNICCGILK